VCWKGAFFVKASRVSALKLWSQVLSIVISLRARARAGGETVRFRAIFFNDGPARYFRA
jgi:hypothetical protein